MTEQPLISLRAVLLTDLLVIAGLALGGAMVLSPRVGLSVLAGGTIATASFLAMQRDIGLILQGPLASARTAFLLRFYTRLTLLGVVLYLVIRYQLVDVVGLLTGLSSIVLSIVLMGLAAAGRNRCAA